MTTTDATSTDATSTDPGGTVTLGAHVRCSDGAAGSVTRVVLDPRTRTVTHLVVTPRHHDRTPRLVPVARITAEPADGDLELGCTLAELATFEVAEERHFLPGTGAGQPLSWPYYYYGGGYLGGIGLGGTWSGDGLWTGSGTGPVLSTSETVPLGEVSVHRGDAVRTTDGTVGHLHGLVLGPDDRVSHLLLQEGHLWGRKQVAIPVTAVTSMDEGIVLRLTTRQVHDLPEITLLPHPTGP